MEKLNREQRLTPLDKLTKKEILSKALRYLQIVDSMEASNWEWYLNEFRGHEDWEIGLTTTIVELKKMLRSESIKGDEENGMDI